MPPEQSRLGRKTRGECASEREDARTCRGRQACWAGAPARVRFGVHTLGRGAPHAPEQPSFLAKWALPLVPSGGEVGGVQNTEERPQGSRVRRPAPSLGHFLSGHRRGPVAIRPSNQDTDVRKSREVKWGASACPRPRALTPSSGLGPSRRQRRAPRGSPYRSRPAEVSTPPLPPHAHPDAHRHPAAWRSLGLRPPLGIQGPGAASSESLAGCPQRHSNRRPGWGAQDASRGPAGRAVRATP